MAFLRNVLIETLWNVNNGESIDVFTPADGINRNIVECKYDEDLEWNRAIDVLIETLWNVN